MNLPIAYFKSHFDCLRRAINERKPKSTWPTNSKLLETSSSRRRSSTRLCVYLLDWAQATDRLELTSAVRNFLRPFPSTPITTYSIPIAPEHMRPRRISRKPSKMQRKPQRSSLTGRKAGGARELPYMGLESSVCCLILWVMSCASDTVQGKQRKLSMKH